MGRGPVGPAGLEEDYAVPADAPHGVTAAEPREIAALARNLPTIWHAPQTGVAGKRRIVRSLLERVIAWAPASSQEVTVHLHWSLGTVTEHRVKRPVRSWEQVASVAVVRQQVEAGQAAGWSSRRIAAELNAAGYQTPRGKPFTAESVRQLRARGGLGEPGADSSRQQQRNGLGRDGSDTARKKRRSRATAADTVD